MSFRIVVGALAVVSFCQLGWASGNQIMFAENEPLKGQRLFCAVVSDFKGTTNNHRADSFWLAVRFSRDVPYSVRVNGKLVKSKQSGTLEEKNSDSSFGENIDVAVTRNGEYRFEIYSGPQISDQGIS
jgi:hypothetical protein